MLLEVESALAILSISDRKSIVALYLLPSLLPPAMQVAGGTKKRWKPSISESRTSFIDLQKVKSLTNLCLTGLLGELLDGVWNDKCRNNNIWSLFVMAMLLLTVYSPISRPFASYNFFSHMILINYHYCCAQFEVIINNLLIDLFIDASFL